ncbi:MAG: POTRA domain-containing protein [Bacteroidia bacterium]
MKKIVLALSFLFLITTFISAQVQIGNDSTKIDYSNPKEYTIGGITVSGTQHLDKNVLILLSGLSPGQKVQIPGDKIASGIENLWKQGLFDDVKIQVTRIQGKSVFLNIAIVERPRLSKFTFSGVKRSEADDLRDKLKLVRGKVVTDYLIANIINTVKDHYIDKGFMNVKVSVKEQSDTSLVAGGEESDNSNTNQIDDTKNPNENHKEKTQNKNHVAAGISLGVILYIKVDKGEKIKIGNIIFDGNSSLSARKLRHTMKDTKQKRWYNIFNSSKYLVENLKKDEGNIIDKYHSIGYRDAKIVKDSVYKTSENLVNIKITIKEGSKYYFRNITWVGNSKYTDRTLAAVLGIKKGDVYNQSLLDEKLTMNPNGTDVSSLYMDNGYLFFQVTPVEVMVENDSIDLEMHIYEGKQAIINKVTVTGNTKTNDRVVLREIRTKPGQLFRRSDIMRTQRELAQLGYFDPEKMTVTPIPHQADGTVDINYGVEEKPSDQVSLSGGWGAGMIVGTVGLSFNNFSARNFFNGSAWRPLPSGDGQKLSLSAQANGINYQSYNASFTEPWLGGKKPNSLTVSIYHSIQSNGQPKTISVNGATEANPARADITINGLSVGLGKRLRFPDDYFSLYQEVALQKYILNNYASVFSYSSGISYNFSYKLALSRNSIDRPIFTSSGSQITLSGQWTPPYSLFSPNTDYATETEAQKFHFVEYQKYKFTASWFAPLTNLRAAEGKEAHNLVFNARAGFGFLGMYNNQIGLSPFQRFYLGGSGLTGYNIDGREIIAMRGYDDQSLSPTTGAAMICKYTLELHYPISLNPQATVYLLSFAEAGNSWTTFQQFDPFSVYRSVGVGVRIFLPMFGLLGFDYGWRLDNVPTAPNMQKSQFHFTIGTSMGEL